MYAPFSTGKQLLGQKYCRNNSAGYPVWTQIELDLLRDVYEYPPYMDGMSSEAVCDYYSGVLPIPCMRGYNFSDVLGSGAGGSVYRLCYKGDATCQYVGKFITLETDASKLRFQNEVDTMREMADVAMPVIDSWICSVPYYDVFKNIFEPKDVGIIISLLADSSLDKVIDQLNRGDVVVLVEDLLQELIDHGVMHRDLKLENIVVYEGALYLIDFGLAWDRSKKDVNVGESNFTLDVVPTEWDPDYDRSTIMMDINRRGD